MPMSNSRGGLSTFSFLLITVIMLLVGLGAIGGYITNSRIVTLQNRNSQLQTENTLLNTQNNQLSTTISNDSNQISSLQGQNSELNSQITLYQNQISSFQSENGNLNNQINNLNSQVSSLQSENSNLQNELANIQLQTNTVYACGNGNGCTLTIWTACGSTSACPLTSGSWYAEGVPDTFDFYAQFTSSVPVTVYFLSIQQVVQFYGCGSISCVSGNYQYFPASTSLDGKFTLAEGCGGYVAIFQSSTDGYMHPDVSITFNPASTSTGVCA